MAEGKSEESEGFASTAVKLFDSFYNRFLLRDIVGKVLPGAMLTALVLVPEIGLNASIHGLHELTPAEIVLAAASFWLLALSIQGLSSRISNFYFYTPEPQEQNDGSHDSGSNDLGARKSSNRFQAREDKFILETEKVNNFLRSASSDEKAQYERFVIIKESCGNAFFCVMLGVFYNVVASSIKAVINIEAFKSESHLYRYTLSNPGTAMSLAILSCLVLWSMFLMFKDHVSRQTRYASIVVKASRSSRSSDSGLTEEGQQNDDATLFRERTN